MEQRETAETERLSRLEKKVRDLYQSQNPNRDEWADWLYDNHVFVVAEGAKSVATRFGGNSELAYVAGMLHDIADTEMSRFDDAHEERSMEIARELLLSGGYSEAEVEIIVGDALENHSCRGGQQPETLEGKALASADATAHLKTNFYEFTTDFIRKRDGDNAKLAWVLPKIKRDFNTKIQYDEVRAEVRGHYESLRRKYQNA